MSERTFKVPEPPGNLSLEDFETTVQQTERINGFLKALARNRDQNQNTFTIERRRPPTNLAKLETYEGDAPPAKDGHSVVCTGDCLVDGQPAKVVAYRQD